MKSRPDIIQIDGVTLAFKYTPVLDYGNKLNIRLYNDDLIPFFKSNIDVKINGNFPIKIDLFEGQLIKFYRALGHDEHYGPRMYVSFSLITITNKYLDNSVKFNKIFDSDLNTEISGIKRLGLVSCLRKNKVNFPLARNSEYAKLQIQVLKVISDYAMKLFRFALGIMFKEKEIQEDKLSISFKKAEFCSDKLVKQENYSPALVKQLFNEHGMYGNTEYESSLGPQYIVVRSNPTRPIMLKVYSNVYNAEKVGIRSEIVLNDKAIKEYWPGKIGGLSKKKVSRFRQNVQKRFKPQIREAWKRARNTKPLTASELFQNLLSLIGRTNMEIFTDFLRSIVNNGGLVTCTYAKTIDKSGPKTGTRKPNVSLIQKLRTRGVLQRLKGKPGVYGLVGEWRILVEKPEILGPYLGTK